VPPLNGRFLNAGEPPVNGLCVIARAKTQRGKVAFLGVLAALRENHLTQVDG
jgi:hypothetical protein